MKNKKWNVTEFLIYAGTKDEKQLKIYHTLKMHGPINTIEAAIDSWSMRAIKPTAEDLCDYINSKRLKGMSLDYAYTEEQFKEITTLEGQALENYKHSLKKKNVHL